MNGLRIAIILFFTGVITILAYRCGQEPCPEGFARDNNGNCVEIGDDDDADSTTSDEDGDGFDSEAAGGNDCDDSDATIYPGADEIMGDGIDQDCDGVDELCNCRYNCYGGDWSDIVLVETERDCGNLCDERCLISCDDYYCDND